MRSAIAQKAISKVTNAYNAEDVLERLANANLLDILDAEMLKPLVEHLNLWQDGRELRKITNLELRSAIVQKLIDQVPSSAYADDILIILGKAKLFDIVNKNEKMIRQLAQYIDPFKFIVYMHMGEITNPVTKEIIVEHAASMATNPDTASAAMLTLNSNDLLDILDEKSAAPFIEHLNLCQ